MAARAQPSEYEIQREVEALRDIRRRSTTPGALAIDPDLPNQSPPSSPTSTYWSGKARSSATTDTSVSGTSQESDSSSTASGSNSSEGAVNPNNPADDPFHLFWVPASVHPEIAPAEFKAFLQEHARNPLSDRSDVSLGRAPSLASRSSLSRQRSMLSRQYLPKEGDADQDDKIVPLRRNRSFVQQTMPQLTISDLQKLEELAEEASESDDPSRLRSVLRRSISLNLSPTALEQMDSMPDMGDEADVPIIVPPPGQILRRAARTKIRKPGLPGEGAAHRFGASRRGRRNSGDGRLSVEQGSNENSESECSSPRRQTLSDDGLQNPRPDSFSEEASIFDAYARDEEEDVHALFTTPPPMVPELSAPPQPEDPPHLAQPEIQTSLLEALGPILDLEQPQPQRPIVFQTPKEPAVSDLSRSPSPEPVTSDELVQTPPVYAQKPFQPAPPSTIAQPIHSIQAQLTASVGQQQQQQQRKEKDKKGLFGKWGSDKSGKKSKADKEREREREKEKEKEGFFGSFFGGKKKQDESSPITNSAGREAAQALLGASKSSKNYVPPTSPGLVGGSPNFSRYPIHVERAIYRLSHIKLANPRRPLYEQVLISNLMFWYLGVINKAQNSTTATAGEPTQAEKEEKEKEEKEREKAEKERLERERLEKEQKEREMEMKKKESGKRGSLTKTPVGGPPGGRRAEMPVKGPQYEIQQQVMQKEYSNGGYNGQGPRNPGNVPNGQPYSRNQSSPQPQQLSSQPYPAQATAQYPPVSQYPPSQNQSYPNSPPRVGQPYDNGGSSRGGLPPGAMAPANMSPSPQPRSPKMGNFQQQHQPPPPNNRGPYPVNTSVDNMAQPPSQRSPARSLSANAVPSGGPPMNGGLRKGNSAHAVTAYDPHRARGRPSEEDDTPLAVYQQQQRR